MKREALPGDRPKTTAQANRTRRISESQVHAYLGVREQLSSAFGEIDLVGLRAFFELLAEWESQGATNANLDKS